MLIMHVFFPLRFCLTFPHESNDENYTSAVAVACPMMRQPSHSYSELEMCWSCMCFWALSSCLTFPHESNDENYTSAVAVACPMMKQPSHSYSELELCLS